MGYRTVSWVEATDKRACLLSFWMSLRPGSCVVAAATSPTCGGQWLHKFISKTMVLPESQVPHADVVLSACSSV